MLHLSSEAPRIIFNEGHHRSSNCTGLGCNYHRTMSICLISLDKFPLLKSHRTATGFSKLFEVHQSPGHLPPPKLDPSNPQPTHPTMRPTPQAKSSRIPAQDRS